MNDALETLGTKLADANNERDAIHVASIAIIAKHELNPGEHVGIVNGQATDQAETLIGIVDPFIEDTIHRGEGFWLLLYPRTITSLRHDWRHPQLDEELIAQVRERFLPLKQEAEIRLRDFLSSTGNPSLEAVMESITYGDVVKGEGLYMGVDASGDIPDTFWDDLEVYTGNSYPESQRAEYFRCAC